MRNLLMRLQSNPVEDSLEKLIVTQLFKEISDFDGTRNFSTWLTTASQRFLY
jgi:hypothetical protein